MRISDWSSDVCSSDLIGPQLLDRHLAGATARTGRCALATFLRGGVAHQGGQSPTQPTAFRIVDHTLSSIPDSSPSDLIRGSGAKWGPSLCVRSSGREVYRRAGLWPDPEIGRAHV